MRYPGIILLALLSCTAEQEEGSLAVAVAANMKPAMHALTDRFEKHHSQRLQLVFASSGQLTAQIRKGAPYDVFISADSSYPDSLWMDSLTTGKPRIYALGRLVTWTTHKTYDVPFDSLPYARFNHLAIPNPATAPYGRAAREAMKSAGIWKSVLPRVVYGQSVSQTSSFLITDAADMVITAKSVVLSGENRSRGFWREIPEELYSPIQQEVVPLTERANEFCDFLISEEALEILGTYGYAKPPAHE